MIESKSATGESTGFWRASREYRRWIAVLLASAGAFGWVIEAFIEMMNAAEPKFDGAPFWGSMTADHAIELAMVSFGLVALLLVVGVVLMLVRLRIGRLLVIGTSALVVLGQAVAWTLAAIPIDAFYNEPPPSMAFNLQLVPFPLLTIVLLIGRQRNEV
ncbi:hypothetical protein ACIRRA_41615 [Nocardia sp. NPDC101769]|uniref:hypothetical protein n=1 Tax=Nocardia sp. NPDC101769 TaxID=3364333 RepID=UPI0037F13781